MQVPAFRLADAELAGRCERILQSAPAAGVAAPADAPASADGGGSGAGPGPGKPAPAAPPAAAPAAEGTDAHERGLPEGAASPAAPPGVPPTGQAANGAPASPAGVAAAAPAAAAAAGDKGAEPMGNGAGPDVRLSPHTSLESTPFPQTPRGFTGSGGVVGGSGNSAGSLTPAAPLMDPNRAFQARVAPYGL